MSKSAVKRGDMPQDEGIREIEKVQAEQGRIISSVTSTPKDHLVKYDLDQNHHWWIKGNRPFLSIKTYTPTGNATLDKELLTDYKGSITKAKNNVMEGWQAGAITKEEAAVQLEKLVTISNKTKKPKNPKSPKTVGFRKIAAKKIAVPKVSNIKISNPNWER